MFSRLNSVSKFLLLPILASALALTGRLVTVHAAGTPTGIAPVLVPYALTSIAGNTQLATGGFGGDGGVGGKATLNQPNAIAADSQGNVYFADTANAVIREINGQSGVIRIVAGAAPSSCVGVTCSVVTAACSDGVLAAGSPIGTGVNGLAIDGSENLYYSDKNYQGVWVIYHSGVQVSNFIQLEDPSGVATAGGVLPGYTYHVGGTVATKAGGCSPSSTPLADKVLATAATLKSPGQIGLDGSGNIFIQDVGNTVVRVINTQSTSQTFFGVTLQPGFMGAIVGCSTSLTTTCGTQYTFGVPAGTALFASPKALTVDQYGNVYQLNGSGAASIFGSVAYAGGANNTALAGLLQLETGAAPIAGDFYDFVNYIGAPLVGTVGVNGAQLANNVTNLVLRPADVAVDPNGNIYTQDYINGNVFRIDVNSQVATRFFGTGTYPTGTTAVPVLCSTTSTATTSDRYGDGCPASQGRLGANKTSAFGNLTFDAQGNLYVSDQSNGIVRKVSVNTQFAQTAVGSSLVQTIQVHFNGSNLPVTTGTTPFPTSSFTVVPGTGDFAVVGVPTCSSLTVGTGSTAPIDKSLDCFVSVSFNPKQPGLRQAALRATSVNGTITDFVVNGVGSGPQISIDGGSVVPVAATGLGGGAGKLGPTAIAIGPSGTSYIADSTNNQIVVISPTGTQTTIGTGLKAPQGVAVDGAENVYISDTGNNQVVKVTAATGVQTTLDTDLKAPQGLTVDPKGNVIVADTGNSRIVMISPFGALGTAPLLAYSGTGSLPFTFKTPVAVATDALGNIYVADNGISRILMIAPGGGDLQSIGLPAGLGLNLVTPNGIVVDPGGNLYVSDSSSGKVIQISSSSGPGSEQFTTGFKTLKTPSGLALDPSGNLYVADSGSNQVLMENRTAVTVNYGTVSLFQPPATNPLTFTNTGNSLLTLTSPLAVASGDTTSFALTSNCPTPGQLIAGLHCTIAPTFVPTKKGSLAETLSVQGGAATISLIGVGQAPLAIVTLSASAPGGLVAGQNATVAATITQPNSSVPPTGTITFAYTVNGVAGTPVTQALTVGSASSTASFTLPTLILGRKYVITANYSGDGNNSPSVATPLTIAVPGRPLTVTSASVSYTYGSPVPVLTGTVSGILPADAAAITIKFVSAATPTTPIGTYPITVQLSGGNYQDYTIPAALTATGAPAVVTENPAPLTIVVDNQTSPYGGTPISYTETKTGLVNGDQTTETFTPPNSAILDVGTYPIIATAIGTNVGNYAIKYTQGTLTITQAGTNVTVSAAKNVLFPTALATAQLTIAPITQAQYKGSATGLGLGTPTGTVTITDTFTPVGSFTAATPVVLAPITLVNGMATYTPTDNTLGTHAYTVAYSGDKNFSASTTQTSTLVLIDNQDFSIASTSDVIQVIPGVVPGGNSAIPGQLAATPEQATVVIAPILGFLGTVNLTCSTPVSYLACSLSPTTLTLNSTTPQTSILSISTPATLPIDFKGQLDRPGSHSDTYLAYLPLGILAFVPLCLRSRRKLSKAIWLALVLAAATSGLTACGGNKVQYFTPVPSGPQTVTVTATGVSPTNGAALTRTFPVLVSIN